MLGDLPFMGDHNSLVPVYRDILACLLRDVASYWSYESINLDIDYIDARLAKEGISFLTKSLPLLGKNIDSSLGTSQTLDSTGFAKARGRATPEFLGWLFAQVYDAQGRELLNAQPIGVKHLRQIAYSFYKLELTYEDQINEKIIEAFVQTEQDLIASDSLLSEIVEGLQRGASRAGGPCLLTSSDGVTCGAIREAAGAILARARSLINCAFAPVCIGNFFPKHGPGSVSTGERQWEKMRFKRFYPTLDEVFSYADNFFSGAMDICDNYHKLIHRRSESPGTAKVVLVPKDSRGPRLISCEPLEYQYIQQGISRELVRVLESGRLTRGRVNFTDQSINRRYALYGSLGAKWVTLDMKDASDRVSLALVKELFRDLPFLKHLLASRSESTKLPSGKIVPLRKFAPMGSALCFPVEAACFWALSVACITYFDADGVHDEQKLQRALEGVKVYGDDLILRTEDYGAVMQWLPTFGLRFNVSKCCTSGSFRESCGLDAFKGVSVTPVRFRKVWDSRRKDTQQFLSYVEVSNNLYGNNYWEAAEYIRELITRKYGELPVIDNDRPVSYLCYRRLTGSVRNSSEKLTLKWCKDTQQVLIKTWVSESIYKYCRLPSWERLRWHLIVQPDPSNCADRGHGTPDGDILPRAMPVCMFPLRRRVTHKRRWCPFGQ
jgi:hypothetical protein